MIVVRQKNLFFIIFLCPRIAALREIMTASIVQFTDHVWNRINSFHQLNILLNALSTLNYDSNANIFLAVQAFKIASFLSPFVLYEGSYNYLFFVVGFLFLCFFVV